MKLPRLFSTITFRSETDRVNFYSAQNEAIGVGLTTTAATFLPVFLTRLEASNLAIGLVTSMPAITGLLSAIILGNYLNRQRNVVPWYSISRLVSILPYVFTGLIVFVIPQRFLVMTVLAIWALVTLPQTVIGVLFNVIMNDVAGPARRYELLSRRWAVLGVSTSLSLVLVGQALSAFKFPLNYQIVFLILSIGGVLSYLSASRIHLPVKIPQADPPAISIRQSMRIYFQKIRSERPFVSFNIKRFVFLTGIALTTPLFPLYYVRVAQASDAWIGVINTAQTIVVIFGYFFWMRQTRRRGNRRILVWTTLGLAIYPALVALTQNEIVITLITGFSGIFLAGYNLVFFDELMKTVPPDSSAIFVAFAQSVSYLSTIIAPLVSTSLANWIGLGGALWVSAAICLIGFAMFWLQKELPSPY